MQLMEHSVRQFFDFARERHQIYIARQAGDMGPWTDDPILQKYRFTNVFRELDRTTIWFREHIRDQLQAEPEVLIATVLFRWFNRITTGEAVFCQGRTDTWPKEATAWDEFLESESVLPLRDSILTYCGKGPYVTGSYIIKTPDGYNKLDGVLKCIEWFCETNDWRHTAEVMLREESVVTLQNTWAWLKQARYLGGFMAYEIVSDLRHTALLRDASDIMTWANPGPGAVRGLSRLCYGSTGVRVHKVHHQWLMQELLELSQDQTHWPQDWPAWEMREVEHTLCEFDKYRRARTGEGRPRGTFHG